MELLSSQHQALIILNYSHKKKYNVHNCYNYSFLYFVIHLQAILFKTFKLNNFYFMNFL